MQVIKPVGREAAARKYDILSALMAHGLAGDQNLQRLVLRLISLITTRYNWQRNDLTMGQREIARLWCVDERTVKREMARLRSLGWINVKRQGARGRVSVLALDLERILLDTRAAWPNIGTDYVARMTGQSDAEPAANVVPFRRNDAEPADGIWGAMRTLLQDEDPALFDAWLAPLTDAGHEQGILHLAAPSRFHATYVRTHLLGRLTIAARRSGAGLQGIRLIP
ncbi:DnaA N-terminal domain-containing protein [Paracoccus sp. R86501]|uniref:DnaA N-terminal domain-containing protein n=1 Tax=Paracoccus sp. R86501 TaxID=3101711 RepID=UPI00366E7B93